MKKLLIFIPIALILAALPGCVGGDDMADYPITNVVELQALGNLANLNEDGRLLNDIDATGFAFASVGDNVNPFTGSFDGQGFVITGLTVNEPAADYVGLFGRINSAKEFKDVELRNCNITGKRYVGTFVGLLMGGANLTNCKASGSVNMPTQAVTLHFIGGLVGTSVGGGSATNCSFEGSITLGNAVGATRNIMYVGGLMGDRSGGTITNCHAIADIVTGSAGNDFSEIGGLIGLNYGGSAVSNSYAQGSMTLGVAGDEKTQIGGFIGWNDVLSDLVDCYDSVDLSIGDAGTFTYIGGFCGRCHGTVTRCRTSGSFIIGNATVWGVTNTGGFIGYNEATISQCSARRDVVIGNTSGQTSLIGGFTGRNATGNSSDSYSRGNVTIGNVTGNLDAVAGFCGWLSFGTFTRVYSVGSISYGAVTGAVTNIGGLVGDNDAIVNDPNCFWDTESSGQAASDGGTGHTTAQMNTQSTFTDAGWDFDAVWSICDPPQPSYPWLQWENIQCLGVIISLIG